MPKSLYHQTPLCHSPILSDITGSNIYLKMEALQPSGSFKDRGLGNLCQHLAKQGTKGIVSSSAGNAGIAASYAGHELGLDVKVIVPESALLLTVEKMLGFGADVITKGKIWDEADAYARKLAKDLSYAYISPFDHPLIWQGYESLIDEIIQQGPAPDAIVTSVGGGGLFCGLVQGLKAKSLENTTIITCETEGAATLATTKKQNKHIKLDKINTIAATLGARKLCDKAFEYLNQISVLPQTVTDKQAVKACLKFADDHHVLIEPSCGVTLALAYENHPVLHQFENIAIIICGGNGVSLGLLKEWRDEFKIS